MPPPLNFQPVVILRGLKRQQVAALTNFVGCFFSCSVFFFLALSSFFFPLVLNDLAGPSAGPLARKTYSSPPHSDAQESHFSCYSQEACRSAGSNDNEPLGAERVNTDEL